MNALQSAREALSRIAAYEAIQPEVWISRFSSDQVLAAAEAVDLRVAAGESLPLAGLTFAVKDNIDLSGLPTTAACPAFAYAPGSSATVVERLQAAGAVAVGKTNLDQFATGLVGTRSPYGAPACVFNREYVSGGSSSGSAVAVAAGLVSFALGTDTAGSGRVPAAFNGLFGFKPTRGRWSTRGLVPACRSLDCISVFTADAPLARRIDNVLAAFDPGDDYSRPPRDEPLPDGVRLGVPRAGQLNFFGDSEAAGFYRAALDRLGGRQVEVDITPLLDAARLLYSGPYVAERTASLKDLLARNPAAIDPVVRAIVQAGAGLSAVDAFEGAYSLAACARAAEAIWSAADVLVLPTTGTIYRISEIRAEPFVLNANLGLYTNFVNLLDLSAVSVPAGFRANGSGFGVSLIGPAWTDHALLDLAGQYAASGGLSPPPLDLGGREPSVRLCVVGAHLHGMPLHWQLTSRNARLVARTRTAPTYRLFAMAGSTPPKPALIHDAAGASLEVEVYELGVEAFGSFTAEVPPPLAIGTVALEDGSSVKGFVAEPRAVVGAEDITHLGGWRAYMARL